MPTPFVGSSRSSSTCDAAELGSHLRVHDTAGQAPLVRPFGPQSGALFVFVRKRPARIKVLWCERSGYCLLYKRPHRAVFQLPVAGHGAVSLRIDGAALATVLAGVEKARVRSSLAIANDYRGAVVPELTVEEIAQLRADVEHYRAPRARKSA